MTVQELIDWVNTSCLKRDTIDMPVLFTVTGVPIMIDTAKITRQGLVLMPSIEEIDDDSTTAY